MHFFAFRFKLLATVPIAYPITNQLTQIFLSKEELTSLIYHNIFEYPLTMAELVKWSAGSETLSIEYPVSSISSTNGFYHLTQNPGAVLKRLMRRRISARKLEIAKRAARFISLVPTVKMVAITGALAMENAADESDIDLMIVTKEGTLWTSRLLAYFVLRIMNYTVRKPGDKNQKDKLCLNMWLDESDLAWHPKKRNLYTAHEIAQVVPLISRDQTYEKFIQKNSWIREYWPNAVRVGNHTGMRYKGKNSLIPNSLFPIRLFEKAAFKLQYAYMKRKITKEVVTPTRALFHPVDWSEFVLSKLQG